MWKVALFLVLGAACSALGTNENGKGGTEKDKNVLQAENVQSTVDSVWGITMDETVKIGVGCSSYVYNQLGIGHSGVSATMVGCFGPRTTLVGSHYNAGVKTMSSMLRVTYKAQDGKEHTINVLTARGTDDAHDMKKNLNLIPVKLPIEGFVKEEGSFENSGKACDFCGTAHAGFLSAYAGIRQYVLTQYHLAKSEGDFPLLLTGHSLGGAMAELMAMDFLHNKFITADKLRLVTFGEPRVGGDTYREYLKKLLPASHVRRVVNHPNNKVAGVDDPVTTLPPNFLHTYPAVRVFGNWGKATKNVLKLHSLGSYRLGTDTKKFGKEVCDARVVSEKTFAARKKNVFEMCYFIGTIPFVEEEGECASQRTGIKKVVTCSAHNDCGPAKLNPCKGVCRCFTGLLSSECKCLRVLKEADTASCQDQTIQASEKKETKK